MIKPKGRPASQCHHCRDNRKHKSIHVTCTCGKKNKLSRSSSSTSINSSTIHVTDCACHKTSHCTCSGSSSAGASSKKNKETDSAKMRALLEGDIVKRSNSLPTRQTSIRKTSPGEIGTSSSSRADTHLQDQMDYGFIRPNETQLSNPELSDNFVIEDILMPFETKKGLFDLFNKQDDQEGSSFGGAGNSRDDISQQFSEPQYNQQGILQEENDSPTSRVKQEDTSERASVFSPEGSDPSPAGFEVVDHMFPLFPLIGGPSFDNENKPLSGLPTNTKKPVPHQPTPVRPSLATQNTDSNSSLPSATESNHNINFGSSFDNNPQQTYFNQQSRGPKRPESVLSIASNSSARSFDFMGNSFNNYNNTLINGGIPSSATSTAYPPSVNDEQNFAGLEQYEENNTMHHHFGKTGLGANKFGSQLSKIESEMYTDTFFDENGNEGFGDEAMNFGETDAKIQEQPPPQGPDVLLQTTNFYPTSNDDYNTENGSFTDGRQAGAVASDSTNSSGNEPASQNNSLSDLTYSKEGAQHLEDSNTTGLIGGEIPLFQGFAIPLANTPK
ncbi:CUP2 [Candida margitis]|uniref:CUP2 n=1 Tax=Candida margitis TaxID=1775924 RepID=UPI002225D991|nr:CUP2 [Candida margitis]KAI5970884.1 CUP2 [Candida margitis]